MLPKPEVHVVVLKYGRRIKAEEFRHSTA